VVKNGQVLDETDMLLGGAFIRQVGRLIDMFRLEEKQLSRDWELEKVQGIGSTKEFQPWTDFQPTEDAEVDTGSSDSEEEEVSNWSDPVDDEPITSEGLFHLMTVSLYSTFYNARFIFGAHF
jgi:hypothetical protein